MNLDSSSGQSLDLQPEIDPLAKQLLANEVVVGFVVGIYKDGEKQVIGYGETEKGKGVAPDGDTIYEIGSASKAFTGVLLADLVLRGRVKLDDPLQKYLPAAAKTDLKNPSNITFEHLATHTSGLPRLPDNLHPADLANPYADYSFQPVYTFLKEHKMRRAPGEYEYSNYGMGLLGVLLARREKMSYEELLVTRIAKPCGMRDTCVSLSKKQRERLAPPYDAALQAAKNWDIPTLAGAGGIRSTTYDMLKFIEANLADDDKPLTKAFRLSHIKRHAMPDGLAIGLGWHIARDGVTRWHNGMSGGYAAWMSVTPGRKQGVVVLSNTAAMQITEIGEKITRIAAGEKIEPPTAPRVVEVAPEVLKSYEGVYAISPQFALTVTLEKGKLMVQATGQQKFQVYPESETKFFYKVVNAKLTFVTGKNGKAERLVLHQNGVDQIATRQDER
ncbi:MAG: serine hydrolase [Pirellulales bacterium]